MVDIFYYHTDHLGTPLVMTNNNGNVCWKARYYPFGELSYEWVSADNYIRFPGQWHDEESDLYYNWHRYYDPTTGRYLQADPLATPAVDNLYGYARNNPLRFIDPTGLWAAHFDPSTNTVTAIAEEGDDLASLYDAMGITRADYSVDKFVSDFKINDATYDISRLVLLNRDFNPAGNYPQNCHGFASYARGAGDNETSLGQLDTDNKIKVAGCPNPSGLGLDKSQNFVIVFYTESIRLVYAQIVTDGRPVGG